jgi:large subunit ribosomal protein L17
MSNLAAGLFNHGRIETTLAKAKALRPFAEKIITLAKKAKALSVSNGVEAKSRAIALKKLAMTYVRDEDAVHALFAKRVDEFIGRVGGYTRIYKLGRRISDAGETALIELIGASDEGRKPRSKRTAPTAKVAAPAAVAETPKGEKAEKAVEKK